MVDKVMFSHVSSEWVTPTELYDRLNKIFKFDLDPCTTKDNPLNTPKFYTKKDNGLEKPWFGNVFVNPPYNKEIPRWLEKTRDEIYRNHVKNVVFLLPARTDTKWFHDYIYKPHVKIRLLKGRLKFRGAKNSAPFPSMIVIFENPYI
jgi:site-specific DNA-methyltransferase (adenine-specific)